MMYAIDVNTVFGAAPTSNTGYGLDKVLGRGCSGCDGAGRQMANSKLQSAIRNPQ